MYFLAKKNLKIDKMEEIFFFFLSSILTLFKVVYKYSNIFINFCSHQQLKLIN